MLLPERLAFATTTRSENGSSKTENVLDLHKKVIFGSGLWLTDSQPKPRSNAYLYVLTRSAFGVAVLVLISQIVDSTSNLSNMEFFTENLYVGIICSMAIVKVLTIMQMPVGIKRLIRRLESMKRDDRISMPEEKRLFRHHRLMARRLTIAFLVVCAFTSSGFSLIPVMDTAANATVRALPFRMWTPFDHTTTPSYEAMYALLSVMAVYAGFCIGVFDTLFVTMMIATIGQLKILQYKLTNIRAIALLNIERKRNIRHSRTRYGDRHKIVDKCAERYQSDARAVQTWEELPSNKDQFIITPGTVLYRRIKPATYGWMAPGSDFNARKPPRKAKDADLLITDEVDCYKRKKIARKQGGKTRRDLTESGFFGSEHLCDDVDAEMQNFLGECVEHHISVLKFIEDMEGVFWGALVFQIFTSLAICVVVYQASQAPRVNVKVIVMLMVTMAGVTQLFMYCWFSSVITHESYNLNEAMYHSDWLHASPSFKRSMQIVLCRTEQCSQLKVAGFVPLSLTMFRRVLKQTYSMYSLITGLDSGVASAINDIGF